MNDQEWSEAKERVRLKGIAECTSQLKEIEEGTGVFLTAFALTLVLLIGALTWVGFAFWGWVR